MSNKTQLQTNNTKLDALITKVNAAKETAASLPEAGGGGSSSESSGIATWTGTLELAGIAPPMMPNTAYTTIYYTDNSLNLQSIDIYSFPMTITISKNTIIFSKSSNVKPTFGASCDIHTVYGSYDGTIIPKVDNFIINFSG